MHSPASLSNSSFQGNAQVPALHSVSSAGDLPGALQPASSGTSQPAPPAVKTRRRTPEPEPHSPSEALDIRPPAHMNDSFTQQLMAQAMRLRSAVFHHTERISFADLAKSPDLAKAARAELDNNQHSTAIETGNSSPVVVRAHDVEIERQRSMLETIDADAAEESRINSQLCGLMCARLDASRRAAERLLGVLQALAGAEAGYLRAMAAVSKVNLVGECDGATLRAALKGFSELPSVVGRAHSQIHGSLAELVRRIQELVSELRRQCSEITGEAQRVQRSVEACRKALHQAFSDHQEACRTVDTLMIQRRHGRALKGSVELDPWLSETKVVEAHSMLHSAQSTERSYLADAYVRVKDTESKRIHIVQQVIDLFLESYRTGLAPIKQDVTSLRKLVAQIDSEADLQQLGQAAAAAAETSQALAARQAETLESVSQELLCSPEIIRQGEMARWVSPSGKWQDCHFVLTRAGFLHWFRSMEDVAPMDCLNLVRCQFEAGDAPCFNLIEQVASRVNLFQKGRVVSFKAPSWEDCCEWAIALREAISTAKGHR
ncbi:hypothetical protein WJX72_012262 [[Myrmecia] bisecta]|uniref:PH domain-containing protein n=1 Tax=[Myrmecia] bisecta TaxID=41462 RepID=A0AAW1Q8D5_9CHLO